MLIEEVIEFFGKIPPFPVPRQRYIKSHNRRCKHGILCKGTVIRYQGGPAPENLYIIKKGEVKVSIKNENDEDFVDCGTKAT